MGLQIKTWIVDKVWYGHHPVRWLLWPFANIYRVLIYVRRHYLQYRQRPSAVPIIVVGNLTVGGAGKTPLVIALVKYLQAEGHRVGVVSRGYGSSADAFPLEVSAHTLVALAGDEPLLIARKTGSPVVIAPHRVDAVAYLLKQHAIDVVISDDGLQHYAMGRSIEIAVIDGLRGLGNGLCLPAGPLRESSKRLHEVDLLVVNGPGEPLGQDVQVYRMDMVPGDIKSLLSDTISPSSALIQPVAAVAGIGHPGRFFTTLKALGLSFRAYVFPDHHPFQIKDFAVSEKTVVMTEKDAVKCESFATDAMYYLPVEATIEDSFWEVFGALLKKYLR
ncbi:MAG: tetraacyldisaccharide 4'-kinase [Legionellales bacterium]|nr:tetraacyldisaccharide 4'-kinase [Legionellales bacterium]